MAFAWRFIQIINDTAFWRKPQILQDSGLLTDMRDTMVATVSGPGRAGRLVESMFKRQGRQAKARSKDTSMTIEQWEHPCLVLREQERERREKERKQGRRGGEHSG